MQIADAAQRWIGVKCFEKEHYPVPDQAAAAFKAGSDQVSCIGLLRDGGTLHYSVG